MKLEDLGYNDKLEKLRSANNLNAFEIGRVISEHKERYIVKTEKGEFEAEITGNLRFSAKSREDFPAVGDWVAITIHDSNFSIIHSILPRFSVISRQEVGKFGVGVGEGVFGMAREEGGASVFVGGGGEGEGVFVEGEGGPGTVRLSFGT